MNQLIYSGKIREGKVGTLSSEDYNVYYDDQKKYAYLDPFPVINYSDDSYRKSVNDSNEIEQYFKLHDSLCISYFNLYKDHLKRGDIVVDIGCGGGALLDLMRNFCGKTIAIEPNLGFRASLEERGHQVYHSIEDCLKDWEGEIDFLISNHVIEHVYDPKVFIASVKELLKPGGHSCILTPNYNDILLKLCPEEFAPFFFRKVHPLYLTAEALETIVKDLDLDYIKPIFFHEFGLANTFYWLKEGVPKGNTPIKGINGLADRQWVAYLEETGQTKDFAVLFKKQ